MDENLVELEEYVELSKDSKNFTLLPPTSDNDILHISDQPFKKSDSNLAYFEIHVNDGCYYGDFKLITIGLVPIGYPRTDHPGVRLDSYGYYGNNGTVGQNGHFTAVHDGFKTGNVVGCGIDFKEGKVFFTQDGDYLRSFPLRLSRLEYYPAVGIKDNASVTINFGNKPFKYQMVKKKIDPEKIYYHVLLTVNGGCYNMSYFDETSQETDEPCLTVSLGREGQETFLDAPIIWGALLTRPQCFIPYLTLNEIKSEKGLDVTLGYGSNETYFNIYIEDQFLKMVAILEEKKKSQLTRTWQGIPFVWVSPTPKPEIVSSSEIPDKIPLLMKKYVDESNNGGWLDIQLKIFRSKGKDVFIECPPSPWHNFHKLISEKDKTVENLVGALKDAKLFDSWSWLENRSLNISDPAGYSVIEFDPPTESFKDEIHHHPIEFDFNFIAQDHKWTCAGNNVKRGCPRKTTSTDRYVCKKCEIHFCNNCVSYAEKSRIRGDFFSITPNIYQASGEQELLIDDISVVAMIFTNMSSYGLRVWQNDLERVFKSLSAEIFSEAFKMWLGIGWEELLSNCVHILTIVKQNIEENKPGNWSLVETECVEIINSLLDNFPVIERHEKYYNELANEVTLNLQKIVDNELQPIIGHNSIFQVVGKGLWKRRSNHLWPLPFYVSPRFFWLWRLFMFVFYLVILLYTIYSSSPTSGISLKEKVGDAVNFSSLENVGDFDSYWTWLETSLIPGLYDTVDKHIFVLADDILLRQVRLDRISCTNISPLLELTVDILDCYSGLEKSPTWKNSVLNDDGKELNSYVGSGRYSSEAYTVVLSRNKTQMNETYTELKEGEDWLDWQTRAIMLEFLIYSPNTELFGVAAALVEFNDVGITVVSHDVAIMYPKDLHKGHTWNEFLLFVIFISYIFQELWDVIIYRNTSSDDEDESLSFRSVLKYMFLYITDFWNVLDIISITSGILYLILKHEASLQLQDYTLLEVWGVCQLVHIANFFGAVTVVSSVFRFLDYLIPSGVLGVLIITMFRMFLDVVRFIFIVATVSVGFAGAFYLFYSLISTDFSTSQKANLNTFLGAFFGITIIDHNNLFLFINTIAGFCFQVFFLLIGVVLLLNLVIALMNSTYEDMNNNSKQNYCFLIADYMTKLEYSQWAPPLNLLQIPFAIIHIIFFKFFDVNLFVGGEMEELDVYPLHLRELFENAIVRYFKGDTEDEVIEKVSHTDDFNEKIEKEEIEFKEEIDDNQELRSTKKELQILGIVEGTAIWVDMSCSERLKLNFNKGEIEGTGRDQNGGFVIEGTYKIIKDGQEDVISVSFQKVYIGKFSVSYVGNFDGKDKISGIAKFGGSSTGFSFEKETHDHPQPEVVKERKRTTALLPLRESGEMTFTSPRKRTAQLPTVQEDYPYEKYHQ